MLPYLLPCLFVLTPVVACTLAIHFFERVIQRRLSTRFGWGSVMWTGWLGTPIHESSHALLCPVFRHRVDEIVFFGPDRKSGPLGYVRHSFREGNWFEEMGNLFIGTAPLVGGSLVLLVLLYLFYPDAASAAFATELNRVDGQAGGSFDSWRVLFQRTQAMFGQLFQLADWTTARWWLFLYLVLSVGSHMAPSRSDYAGSRKGALIAVGLIAISLFVMSLLQVNVEAFASGITAVAAPLLTVLVLATGLCGLSTLAVVAITALLPERTRSAN